MNLEAREYFRKSAEKIRDNKEGISQMLESEAKAPRKIILWVIGFQVIQFGMLSWLIYRTITAK